jgi:A/G-specific adenine glycosylase
MVSSERNMKTDFTKKLLEWNRNKNFRSMPWKNEPDAYRIWISEIILQQTRVEQGIAYYEKFITSFPTIQKLAQASEKEIFKLWEGLGYYSRCRNLIATAKKLVSEFHGSFPTSYKDILSLPGVGPYIAAAIASFAFGQPYAVVDGNVERVLARYFGITTPVGSSAGKKIYNSLAMGLLDKKNPGAFNQAVMDFGATICKPRNPLCNDCNQVKHCQAYKKQWTDELPRKRIQLPKKKRQFYYFIIRGKNNKIWIRERKGKDIWQNLFEFILVETGQFVPHNRIHRIPYFVDHFGKKKLEIKFVSRSFNQKLTHQSITANFVHLEGELTEFNGYQSVTLKQLRTFPFPKLIADYLKKHNL